MEEVLPSVRRHGAYMTKDVLERTLQAPDYIIGIAMDLKVEKEKRRRLEAEKMELEAQRQALQETNAEY